MTAWMSKVKAVAKREGCSYKEAMSIASAEYKRTSKRKVSAAEAKRIGASRKKAKSKVVKRASVDKEADARDRMIARRSKTLKWQPRSGISGHSSRILDEGGQSHGAWGRYAEYEIMSLDPEKKWTLLAFPNTGESAIWYEAKTLAEAKKIAQEVETNN